MSLTTDRDDPGLHKTRPDGQQETYLILSAEERAKGFVRPVRHVYVHKTCGAQTRMGQELSETYSRSPGFYGATFCVQCRAHFPVTEFTWLDDGQVVGS